MKRNECLRFAIHVLVVLLLVPLLPSMLEAKSLPSRMTCTKDTRKTYWLRNSCTNGFVVMKNRRILAQASHISQNDPQVEMVKESCVDHESVFFSKVKSRFYFAASKKYICFSKNGRVTAVSHRHAYKRRNLCVFAEMSVPQSSSMDGMFIVLQSAYNPNWYLGFGPQTSSQRRRRHRHQSRLLTSSGQEAFYALRMRPDSAEVRLDKCNYKFSTGSYSPVNRHSDWSGLYHLVAGGEPQPHTTRLHQSSNSVLTKQRSSLEAAVMPPSWASNRIDDMEEDDTTAAPTMMMLMSPNSSESSSSSSSASEPLPAPLAQQRRRRQFLQRRLQFSSAPRHRDTISYFYDHNKLRDSSHSSTSTTM